MTIRIMAFSDRGMALANRMAELLQGEASRCGKGADSLSEWTASAFRDADALIYVGAAGIAVRAIAPFLQGKSVDPAVLVMDEGGQYIIPILSGHLGGANALARRLADMAGAQAVITTATDVHGLFAVDDWAREQGCAVSETGYIKGISGKLLRGERAAFRTDFPIEGEMPQELVQVHDREDFRISVCRSDTDSLAVIPRIAVLGVGCRKGTPTEKLEQLFGRILLETGLDERAFCAAATIDIKAEEKGLLAFCKAHGWPLQTYTAQALQSLSGEFTASPFVMQTTGTDNVCERSAVLCSGGELICRKTAGDGVTMAVALKPCKLRWPDRRKHG